MLSQPFQALTWMPLTGGALFTLGGMLPLLWFVVSRARHVVEAQAE